MTSKNRQAAALDREMSAGHYVCFGESPEAAGGQSKKSLSQDFLR
jgi:hypothetical protein